MLEPVQAGAVGVVQAGDDVEVDRVGKPAGRRRRHGGQLGVPADRAEPADDAIADGPALDAVAERGDDAGDLAAGHVRRRRLELVLVLEHQRVGERHRRRGDLDEQLARGRTRVVDLLDDEVLRRTELRQTTALIAATLRQEGGRRDEGRSHEAGG